MPAEPVQAQAHCVIFFESLSSNDRIIDAGCVARDRTFFAPKSILDFNFFILIDCAVKWHCNFFAMPCDCLRL